jgi:O-antigen ligase
MRLLSYAGVFLVSVFVSQHRAYAKAILGSIVIAGALITGYAMLGVVINRQSAVTGLTLWIPQEFFFSGTFVNRNHYATYAGIGALSAFVLADPLFWLRIDKNERPGWRVRAALLAGERIWWLGLGVVLVVGVVLSASRAANACFALVALIMIFVTSAGVGRFVLLAFSAAVYVMAALATPVGHGLLERISWLATLGDQGREVLRTIALQGIETKPLTGWGLDSFESVFTLLQPPSFATYFTQAHNTYLETILDLGMPGAVALFLSVAIVAAHCWRGVYRRQRDRRYPFVAVFVSLFVGLHAAFDYSLQVPAVAWTYASVLGMGWAQARSSRERLG